MGYLALAGAAAGCADVRLEFKQPDFEPVLVDDLLAISGDFCTSPAGDVAYPVKIMFVVDGSGSQQFSDQNRQRAVAVEETVNALIGEPNVYFKIVVFNASISATPSTDAPTVFSNDMGELVAGINDLAEADTLTDYQGALGIVYQELLRDMESIFRDNQRGRAELARTKYVVIFISDGLPDPQCLAGLCNDIDVNRPPYEPCGGQPINRICEDQSFLNCLLQAEGTVCIAGICEYDGTFCNEQPEAAQLFGGIANTELAAGNDYNQPYQILQKVDEVMELAHRFEVGELRIHAGLVLDPQADPAVIEVFGDPAQAAPMMRQMAELGEGQYLEFYGGDTIDFVAINFDALKQQRVVRSFFADNPSARPVTAGLASDTDRDGLSDLLEFEIGSQARNADTDGDGYSDALEWRLRGIGFHFDNPCLPAVVDMEIDLNGDGIPDTTCDPTFPNNCDRNAQGFRDFDRDGLHDCEERRLGTDPRNPDSDADGIPDQLDFALGLDPLRWDADGDADLDGLTNLVELQWHLDPLATQTDSRVRDRYRYDRDLTGYTVDGRACFDFAVRNMHLAPVGEPADFAGRGVGFNRLMLYVGENLADALSAPPIYRVACVDARYVPPSLKTPAAGEVVLGEEDFHYLQSSDPLFNDPLVGGNIFAADLHCLDTCSDDDGCSCPQTSCQGGVCRATNWTCCSDDDCGGGRFCIGHACRRACRGTPDCGNGVCAQGYCWTACALDDDCSGGQGCHQGHCWNLPAP